jgi:hypothetical protein
MDPELMNDTPVDLVRQGERLMRIENDTMLQIAVQRPRKEQEVTKAALQELELNPEQAKSAYYSIPYKERIPGQPGQFKITKVEGGSIKAAMALARRWGNCTVGGRVMSEDEQGWDIEGVFIDLESNFRVSRPFRVTKFYKARTGEVTFLNVDRQLQALQSGASKAIRNAVLAGLPAYLVNGYVDRAKVLTGGKLDAKPKPEVLQSILNFFSKMKVTQAQLEKYLDLPLDKWLGSEVADLRGLGNAIQDGQIKAEEAFSDAVSDEPGGTKSPYQEPKGKSETQAPPPIPYSAESTPRADYPSSIAAQAASGVHDDEVEDEALAAEARAREQAEANPVPEPTPTPEPPKRGRPAKPQAPTPPAPPLSGPALRQACWSRLTETARAQNTTAIALLGKMTNKGSLASLNDAEVKSLYDGLAF